MNTYGIHDSSTQKFQKNLITETRPGEFNYKSFAKIHLKENFPVCLKSSCRIYDLKKGYI